MTRNESFKRRVRERMAKTGEKYGAARRVLIKQSPERSADAWVSQPQHSDTVIKENTGRGWDAWRGVIEAWPDHVKGHAAVAAWLQSEHGVDGWWAQATTVGWERITGRRLPHQMADGTFTVNASATIRTDPAALREMLLDEGARADLFRDLEPTLRSRPTSKNIRIGLREGVAELALTPREGGRASLTIQHAKLPSPDDVSLWKSFWTDWLQALDEG